MRRTGARPLTELYRRLPRLGDGDQRELAAYLVALAHRVEVKGGSEAMLLVGFLAIDAGQRGFPRWLAAPSSDGNPFLDASDLAMLAEFADFARRVRDLPRRDALGPSGRVRVDVFLRERGLSDERIAELEKRAYRFLAVVRDDAEAPRVLRGLPAFVPATTPFDDGGGGGGGWRLGAAAAVAAIVVALVLALGGGRRPAAPARPGPHRVFAVTLDGQPRVVVGHADGRWRMVGAGGVEDVVPPSLWLPFYVDGGAAGDLDGDGRDELVLFSSAPLEIFDDVETGIWVFRRGADGGWRVLDRVPLFVGADAAGCRAVRDRIARDGLTPELRRAREACPSRIGAVRVHDRALWVMQLHYGRQILRTTCGAAACAPLERVLAVGSDLTSAAWIDDTLVAGTGCWSGGGAAYGVLVYRPGHAPRFTWTGGRTSLAPLGGRRVAVLVGTPCDGLAEQPMIAARDGAAIELRERSLGIAELDAAGRLRWLDTAPLERCCAAEPSLTVVGGEPPLLALASSADETEQAPTSLRLFRLDRPLGAQRPAEHALAARMATVAALDLDGDGRDELAVTTADVGLAWFTAEPGRLTLR